jgi:HIRAN domain
MSTLLVASRSSEPQHGGWSPIGRLEFDNGTYRFVYTQGARTAKGFTPFSGMEKLDDIYESAELFPIFANRLLPKSRPEYDAFLQWSGFDPANPPDPLVLLGVTEGIRRTDLIEVFPCPVPDQTGCFLNKFFLHGLRYMPDSAKERVQSLKEGEPLYLMPDFMNETDINAVALRTVEGERFMLGYVPRYLAQDVWKIVQGCHPDFIKIFVHRVNHNAPLQQRLLCRMHACWPEDFKPCSGDEFQPIPAGVSALCTA